MPGGQSWPRITVVTPSYNQAYFLEETLRSVLLQGYPNLQYIVMDGGSTDGSQEIIKRYAPWLSHWVSAKDRGQSHAINRGWSRATGELLSFLNSDDTYLPGALARVGQAWVEHARPAAIVGAVQLTDNESRPTGPPTPPHLPRPAPLDLSLIDHEQWLLPQASGFFARTALDRIGCWLREDLHYTLDRELYYRLCRAGEVLLLSEPLATYRFHLESKSVSKFVEMYLEAPKSLAYCDWGGRAAQRQRRRIARWRVAQGHRRFVAWAPSRGQKAWHLLAAGFYRPGYLLGLGFYRAWLDALGLSRPARWLWHLGRAPRTATAGQQ